MKNIPVVKMGFVAVSRDCFEISLSARRARGVLAELAKLGLELTDAGLVVENEKDMSQAVATLKQAGCNALVVYLGNFGPEAPSTLFAKHFEGPVMYVAAAEERGDDLVNGRGDAYCGMLNCSYNLGLRKLKAVIPEYPIGSVEEIAEKVAEFLPVARALIGLSTLKVITFGPRPQDFFACNAPLKGFYDLGIEVQENSELDLLRAYQSHEGDSRIEAIAADMANELGADGNQYPEMLPRMAQFELTLLDWMESNKGASEYVIFANKCWPAFPETFGFEPCYVNSRLASRGIPVGCEVDMYGALSEYIAACITQDAVTLLDINNTVPQDLYDEAIAGKYPYALTDTFMGFHCGNTPMCKLSGGKLKYMLIQNRLLEGGGEPDFTRGTLEGLLAAGDMTFFRLHGNADGSLQAYIAQGEVLPVTVKSFGGIGVIAIPEMKRFYRHVLIEKRYPHHGAVAFGHIGKALYTLFRFLGIADVGFNQPKGMRYSTENPFD